MREPILILIGIILTINIIIIIAITVEKRRNDRMRKSTLRINTVPIVFCLIFIGTIVIPGTIAQPTQNSIQSNNNQSCDNPTNVRFCFGFIRDIYEIKSDHEIIGYGFHAGNVVCTTRTSGIPVFHHFYNGEELSINVKYIGTFHCSMILPDFKEIWFICAWSFIR